MPNIGTLEATLTADNSGFVSGIGESIDSLTDMGSLLGTTKGKMAALGAAGAAAAAGGLAASVSEAAKFNRTIAGAAARAGATSEAFREFGQAARSASLESAFGAKQAGQGLRFLAKSGFSVREATSAIPGVLQGATAAGMGVAKMGEIASNALRAFNRDASETESVMDVLVAASTSANTSVQELGLGIATAGGIASSVGMTIEQTTAILSKLQDAGIGASQAGTALRAGIAKVIDPSKEANQALGQLGVNVRDSSGEFVGLIDLLGQLEKAGASSSQILKIFGRRAGPKLQTVLNQGISGLDKFEKKLNQSEGTSERISSFIESTLVEKLKILWGSIKTLASLIGQPLIPVLKGLVTVLQVVVSGFTQLLQGVRNVFNFISSEGSELEKIRKELQKTGEASKKSAKESDKMADSAQAAAAKAKTLGESAEGASKGLKSAANAQSVFNKSLRDFQNMDLSKQRKALDDLNKEIKKRSQRQKALRLELKDLRKIRSRLQKRGAQLPVSSKAGARVLGMIGRTNEEIDKREKKLKRINDQGQSLIDKQSEARSAQEEMTESENRQLQLLRKQNKIENASTSIVSAQSKERKLQLKLHRNQLKLEKKLSKIRSKESVPQAIKEQKVQKAKEASKRRELKLQKKLAEEQKPEGPGGFRGGFDAGQAATQQARQKMQGRKDVRRAKLERAGTAAERASNKPKVRQKMRRDIQKSLDKAEKKREKRIKSTQKWVDTLGRGVTQISRAAGATKGLQEGLNAAVGAASGLAKAGVGAATGNPLAMVSGGIGALTSIIGGIAGATGRNQGGTTSPASQRRSQRKFADMLADRLGNVIEESQRDITQISIDASGALVGNERQVATKLTSLVKKGQRTQETGE